MGEGLAVLLLVLLVGGLAGGEVLARLLPRWGYRRGATIMRALMFGLLVVYGGVLLAVSLTSREIVLNHGVPKRFCGFYLDCHMAAAVESVDRTPAIGGVRATGTYYVVNVRVSSDARRATLWMGDPDIFAVDAGGTRYRRDAAAEREMEQLARDSGTFSRPVVAGGSFTKPVVFDIPTGATNLRMMITDARGVDRVLEALLIGDEDSLLHRPVTFRL